MTSRRVLLLIALVLAGAVIGVRQWRKHYRRATGTMMLGIGAHGTGGNDLPDALAPDDVRITVEVLNATKIHGLGRRATLYLRDRGFDVVLIGTTGRQQDATVVLDRSHHPEWAQRLARAMHARVQERPDTSGYVDATVLVGRDWTPPTEPFYP